MVHYRFGISGALNYLGIAHGAWNNKPLKSRRDLLITHIQEFPRSCAAINSVGDNLAAAGPFTHIIAGTIGCLPGICITTQAWRTALLKLYCPALS